MEELWEQVNTEVFNIDKPYTQINFPDEGGITAYFSRNMSKADLALLKEFCDSQKLDLLNTRTFKQDDGRFVVTVGSIDVKKTSYVFKDHKFEINYGEFAPYLVECNHYLTKCLDYCANETQEQMIRKYIEHFQTGNISAHKDSQRLWVKDKGPVVESNIGWIETYKDPENSRAYFEGWVAIVDKVKSEKFQALVKNSEQIIPLLPWPKSMEKENFMAPDFTTLDVIGFATSSCPLGINIPNYDDIRETVGFKNVFLNNSLGSYAINAVQFATPEQAERLTAWTIKTYQCHVACHELLGHGVGKLIYRNEDGSCESYTDPITGETFESCYETGEVWNSKFAPISSSYEECRADTCGFFLCTLKEVYTLFGFSDDQVGTLLWVNVMN